MAAALYGVKCTREFVASEVISIKPSSVTTMLTSVSSTSERPPLFSTPPADPNGLVLKKALGEDETSMSHLRSARGSGRLPSEPHRCGSDCPIRTQRTAPQSAPAGIRRQHHARRAVRPSHPETGCSDLTVAAIAPDAALP